MGVQCVVLEHHGDVAVLGGDVIHEVSVDVEFSAGDFLQACDHAQRGGLSAAGRPNEDDKFLVLDVQVDIVYSGYLVVVDLFQTFEQNLRHKHDSDERAHALSPHERVRTASHYGRSPHCRTVSLTEWLPPSLMYAAHRVEWTCAMGMTPGRLWQAPSEAIVLWKSKKRYGIMSVKYGEM